MNVTFLLQAIAMVESNNDANKVGPNLEVSQFQIAPRVWKANTNMPISQRNPKLVREVALKRIETIRRALPYPYCNTPFWIGACWSSGTGVVKRILNNRAGGKPVDQLPDKLRKYSFQIQSLYYEYEKNRGQHQQPKPAPIPPKSLANPAKNQGVVH